MFGPTITSLLNTIISVLILVLIVRAIFSWLPGMLYTQAGRYVLLATEWYLAPIRRVIPPVGGLDLSFLVGILILYALQSFIVSGNPISAIVGIVRSILILFIIMVLIRIFFNFFQMDPWHPVTQMVMQVTEPFARPFRQWFPRRQRGFDWAPVAALVVLLAGLFLLAGLQIFGIG